MVCRNNGKGPCREEGVTYNIECAICGRKYYGETARTAYVRGKEHLDDIRKENERSPLVKHAREDHYIAATHIEFKMNVIKTFRGDAMERKINEAVHIHSNTNNLNQKEEWRYKIT